MKKPLLISLTAITMICAPTAYASDATLADSVRACGKIQNDADRLKCFDAIAISPKEISAPQEVSKKQREDAFGAQAIRAREKSLSNDSGSDDKDLKEMTFKILDAGTTRSGKLFFIMQNGQIWRQLPADTTKIRIPRNISKLEVTIKRKMLGSHTLTLRGRSIKVKRLK